MPNFGIIGKPLLRPEPGLAAEATELYAANVPPGSIVVGTHIRFYSSIACRPSSITQDQHEHPERQPQSRPLSSSKPCVQALNRARTLVLTRTSHASGHLLRT